MELLATPRRPAAADAGQAKGGSWLFFGNRSRASDFLYRNEFDDYLRTGVLTRLDLAFSRDGAEPVCPAPMWENSTELFDLLEHGAYLYVCGDAERMTKDVDAALHAIVSRASDMDTAEAHTYVNNLIKSHRYLRDLY